MPIYDFHCDACGPFAAMRAIAERDRPAPCPACGTIAARLVTAPSLALMSGERRRAHATNERASHAPRHSSEGGGGARHRPHIRERPAFVAKIIVDRHFIPPPDRPHRDRNAGRQIRAAPHPVAGSYLSCESGIWMSPLICLIGPAEPGMMSKSKISVGSHRVAQAFGTSTTPEIWPWHGAVPRIE